MAIKILAFCLKSIAKISRVARHYRYSQRIQLKTFVQKSFLRSKHVIYTYIRGDGKLIVFLLELFSSCMISSNFHVIAQKYLSVAVNPVKHLKTKV